jgi:hypothetical protein
VIVLALRADADSLLALAASGTATMSVIAATVIVLLRLISAPLPDLDF